MPGCPIRIFTDHKICASPRNFSQLITSFIASESLGIRHTPLLNLLYFLPDQLRSNELFCFVELFLIRYFLLLYCFTKYVNERGESPQTIKCLSQSRAVL